MPIAQPDHFLSQIKVNRQFLHTYQTMLHPSIIRKMTKELDTYVNVMIDETNHSLSLVWGNDTK